VTAAAGRRVPVFLKGRRYDGQPAASLEDDFIRYLLDEAAVDNRKNFQGNKKKVYMVPISPGMLRITKRYRGKFKDLRQTIRWTWSDDPYWTTYERAPAH